MAVKKKKVSKRTKPVNKLEKEPEYMIQINDPKMLRKDILESLREVIIFMQGYENFLRIQEEKLDLIAALKDDVKELRSLAENKLPKYLPKGKLRAVMAVEAKKEEEEEPEASEVVETVPVKEPRSYSEKVVESSELDALESQLKDIERQLRNIK